MKRNGFFPFSFMSVDQNCLHKSHSNCARWIQCVCLSSSGSFMDAVARTLIGILTFYTNLTICLLTFTHRDASDGMHDTMFINVGKQQLLLNFQRVYNWRFFCHIFLQCLPVSGVCFRIKTAVATRFLL